MRQSETPFSFSNFETKQKPGIFTREIGKSGYFVLSGRYAVVSGYTANFSQTKKIVNLPGSGVFFSTEVKKKIRNSGKIRRWPIPVLCFLSLESCYQVRLLFSVVISFVN